MGREVSLHCGWWLMKRLKTYWSVQSKWLWLTRPKWGIHNNSIHPCLVESWKMRCKKWTSYKMGRIAVKCCLSSGHEKTSWCHSNYDYMYKTGPLCILSQMEDELRRSHSSWRSYWQSVVAEPQQSNFLQWCSSCSSNNSLPILRQATLVKLNGAQWVTTKQRHGNKRGTWGEERVQKEGDRW